MMKKDDYKELIIEKNKKYFNYEQIYRKPKKNVHMIFSEKNKLERCNSNIIFQNNQKLENISSTSYRDNKSGLNTYQNSISEINEKNNFNENYQNFRKSIKRKKSPLNIFMNLETKNSQKELIFNKAMKRKKSPLAKFLQNSQNFNHEQNSKKNINFENSINLEKSASRNFLNNSEKKNPRLSMNFSKPSNREKSLSQKTQNIYSRKSLNFSKTAKHAKSPLQTYIKTSKNRKSSNSRNRQNSKSQQNSIKNFLQNKNSEKSLNNSRNSIREKSPLNIYIGNKSPRKSLKNFRNSFSNISRKSFENEKMLKMGNNPIMLKTTILSKQAEIQFLKEKIAEIYEPKKKEGKNCKNENEYNINKMEISLINLKNEWKIQNQKNKDVKRQFEKIEKEYFDEIEAINQNFEKLKQENQYSMEMEMQFKYKNNDEEVLDYLKNRIRALKPKSSFLKFLPL